MEKQHDRLIELIKEARKVANSYAVADINETIAEQLLKNGVIVPPCKVGDKVYTLFYKNIDEGAVVSCEYSRASGFSYMSSNGKVPTLFNERNIGKTVFFTKEEAEAALKGGVQE